MSRYPLIDKLGLTLDGIAAHYVRADELEKILAAAPIYYYSELNMTDDTLTIKRWGSDTHQARAILMEPITKIDTAESLLREYLVESTLTIDWIKRARRVVGNPE